MNAKVVKVIMKAFTKNEQPYSLYILEKYLKK